jgi:hypothetical protein
MSTEMRWCPGAESNHRHEDFQSTALPTELPGRILRLSQNLARRERRVLNLLTHIESRAPIRWAQRNLQPGRTPRRLEISPSQLAGICATRRPPY